MRVLFLVHPLELILNSRKLRPYMRSIYGYRVECIDKKKITGSFDRSIFCISPPLQDLCATAGVLHSVDHRFHALPCREAISRQECFDLHLKCND